MEFSAVFSLKRLHLFLRVLPLVAGLIAANFAIHELGFEFIEPTGLASSLIASATFIVGFLLSHVLADYKEAERLPGELRVSLEAIYDDVRFFAETVPETNFNEVAEILSSAVAKMENAMHCDAEKSDFGAVIARIDELPAQFAKLEDIGLSQRYMVRLRNHQDNLRKCLYRIYYIQ
jgi:hypothetical protein